MASPHNTLSEQTPQPLVYVTTPVYNGEAYLRECIESVLAQTYSNWVYTIVNNCSTDRTLEIAQEYAAKDARIQIHTNESFLPVIDNHNLAYSLIPPESQYCKPLMADDWLLPECISEMIRVAIENPSIGLVSMSWSWSDGGQVWDGPPGAFVRGYDICRAALLDERPTAYSRNVFGCPTNQLIRADLIRKREPFNNPSNLQADFEVCFDVLQESDCGFVHRALAFNRLHKKNISSQFNGFETTLLGNLTISVKFGPVYLTEKEQQERLERQFSEYYRVLARHFLRGREPQFWQLHRSALQEIGYSLDEHKLALAVSEAKPWQDRVDQLIQKIGALIPENDTFILVDDDQCYPEELMAGRRKLPFLERDGAYWGNPEDDPTAIRELERLRQSGAGYIVLAWPAFWWLDYYTGFRNYLDSEFRCITRDDDVVIFDLR